MRLVVQEQAAVDLENIYSWRARDKPRAARATVEKLEKKILGLLSPGTSYIGRIGREPGTRELVVHLISSFTRSKRRRR